MVTGKGIKTNLKLFGLLSILTGLFLGVGLTIGGETGLVIALLFAGVFNFGSYWFSDKIVLKLYNAEPVPEEEMPELHSTLERLSENAGIPKPRLYRNSMEVPNAFATGRSPKKGVVCVTDGLLKQLNDEEVAGVIAHELAHIKNRDTLINASVATIAGAIAVLARIAFWGAMFSGDDDIGEMAGAMIFMIVTPIIAILIKMAISRKMEFRADSTGVDIHGKKEGLMAALQKISSANRHSNYKASQVQEAGSNLFIDNPFSGDKLTKYFSTHPPLENRLENIQNTEVT
jgi:heat shock protein HtpX